MVLGVDSNDLRWETDWSLELGPRPLDGTQALGRIQKADPLQNPIVYSIGVLESRIGGSTCWILPGVLGLESLLVDLVFKMQPRPQHF